MIRKFYCSLFLLFTCCFCALGQKSSENQIIVESILGEYITEFPDESSRQDIIDYLLDLNNNPINLNYCSRQDLRSLPFLTEYHVNNFIYYRSKYGKLLSIYELHTIEGFDQDLISKLLLFCTLDGNEIGFPAKRSPAKQQLVLKMERSLEEKQGYKKLDNDKPKYRGDANKLLLRYNYSKRGKYDFGLTLEKDPGERLGFAIDSNYFLFDYTSFYFSLKNKGIFKNVIIGDYRLQSGQGLVFGSSFSFGKSSNVIHVGKSYNSGIRAYQSSFEHKSFSGIGINISRGKFNSNVVLSNVKRDATLKSDDKYQYLESLRENGYHRTDSELSSRKNVNEKNLGINIEYQNLNKNLKIGTNYLLSHFSIPLRRKASPENIYDFSGQINHLISLYADYSYRGTHIYGEAAKNLKDGKAILLGLTHHIYGSIYFSSLYRNYSKDFQSFHGNAFAENSKIKNEKGIYLGLKFSPIKYLTTEIYLDKYEHPWLKYNLVRPSVGRDLLFKLNYSRYKFVDAYLIFRSKLKDISQTTDSEAFEKTQSFVKNLYLLNLKIFPNLHWTFQQRFQLSNLNLSNSLTNGFLLSTSINYMDERIGFSLTFTTFDTENFENRQYIYLRTVPYSYSVSSFQGKGSNFNLFFKFNLTNYLSLHAGFNQSYFPYTKEIGSGNEKLVSDKKSTFRIMATLDF